MLNVQATYGVTTAWPQCSQLLGYPHFTQVSRPQYLFWHLTFTFSPVRGISFPLFMYESENFGWDIDHAPFAAQRVGV